LFEDQWEDQFPQVGVGLQLRPSGTLIVQKSSLQRQRVRVSMMLRGGGNLFISSNLLTESFYFDMSRLK